MSVSQNRLAWGAALVLMLAAAGNLRALDLEACGIEKSWLYDQTTSSGPTPRATGGYVFSAYSIEAAAGQVLGAAIRLPNNGTSRYLSRAAATLWRFEEAFDTAPAMDQIYQTASFAYPYRFTNTTAQDGIRRSDISFMLTTTNMPVLAGQNLAAGQTIDPSSAFTLQWTTNGSGSSYTGDLIQVVVEDLAGNSLFASPGPHRSATLRYNATSAVIPAATLPGGADLRGKLILRRPGPASLAYAHANGYLSRVTIFPLHTAGGGPPPARTLQVATEHGAAAPPAGAYTNSAGTALTNSVSGQEIQGDTQFVCAGWTMTGNAPFSGATNWMAMVHTNQASLTWTWQTNVRFAAIAGTGGSVSASATGWRPLGGSVTVTASPAAYHHFAGWTGDIQGEPSAPVMTLTMDRARAVQATFAANLATHGVPEAWLAGCGWSNAFDDAALGDQDGDGRPTWEEYHSGTDPRAAASFLGLVDIQRGAAPTLAWRSVSSRCYRVSVASGTPAGPVTLLHARVLATQSVTRVSDPSPPAPDAGFYRLEVLPP